MTQPDLQGCPRCHKSLRPDVRRCPGCGLKLKQLKIELAIGARPIVIERLIPEEPDNS